MVFRADAEWAKAYMKKRGLIGDPDLSATPPMTGACKVPEMADGEPCRRCGSGLASYRVTLTDGEDIWVCDVCEKTALKRLDLHCGRDE